MLEEFLKLLPKNGTYVLPSAHGKWVVRGEMSVLFDNHGTPIRLTGKNNNGHFVSEIQIVTKQPLENLFKLF